MTDTADNNAADAQFIEYVVKQIVSNPDEVKVDRKVDEMGVLIELQVAKDDMGRVVGKNGQTAKSLRVLLRVIGSRNNARVNMKILEPEGSEGAPSSDDSTDSAPDLSADADIDL